MSSSVRPIAGRISRAALFAGLAACWTGSKGAGDPPPPPPPPPPADAQVIQAETSPPDVVGEPMLAGTVREKGANAPLASATVELHDANGRVASANTDAGGHYTIANVVAGDYQLVVRYSTSSAVGSAQQPISVRDRAQVVDVDIDLLRRKPPAKPYGAPPARRRMV